ncbi:MAG: DEAD/DEAH box helicase, partial [Reyranella sp.]
SMVIFGGVGMQPQINRLHKGVDILVATPGRLLDLQQQGFMDLSTVEILVLDEADRMLDMGFLPDVKKILALMPKEKQSLLFSATFSDEIRDLANSLLRDPRSIQVTPRNTTVQRITQVVHPVGRGKKKQLLAHIIQEHDWSQVLVFTRTKFGANNVAEFLNKNGVTAMALHGNKSQGARTQALSGFKSGDIRALVATDIAARGIDIDDLPHVVNYEIPNVPEDYVHRIGRTGRAGREGQAVSLVCLDEEGFMQEIERFTKQQIPVQPVEGFGPEPGERAEPIAMGRQTLWGGAGKPPSRDVMAAAAKAARQEMMQRIRDNKGDSGGKARGAGGNAGANGNGNGNGRSKPAGGRPAQGANGGGRNGGQQRPPQQARPQQPQRPQPVRASGGYDEDRDDSNDSLPRNVDPLRTALPSRRDMTGVRRPANGNGGQPDPMRTSIDSMGAGARRGGGGGGGNRNRGNGGGGGGGGYGARNGNPTRKYGS